jgi:hypothetical protein
MKFAVFFFVWCLQCNPDQMERPSPIPIGRSMPFSFAGALGRIPAVTEEWCSLLGVLT